MLPVTTTSVRVERRNPQADAYEPADPQFVAEHLKATISGPGGSEGLIGGSVEIVDARLHVDALAPALVKDDVVVDETTGDTWRVVWRRIRIGFGLDHQVAGLVAVRGASLG
jgi:hypothetical protein